MKHVFGMLRIFALALSLLAFAITITVHHAEAQVKESLRGFGQQLAALGGFSPHSAPRKLFVNGLEFTVLTVSTPLGITDALDRFQGLCHSAANIDLPTQAQEQLHAHSAGRTPESRVGVIREDADKEGFFACIDVGENATPDTLMQRLSAFGQTQNLRSLGQLRYALARRGTDVTTLVIIWTDGDAKLNELFPKHTDAPGRDLVDLPRPAHGHRLLSAFEQGKPFGIATYRVEGETKVSIRNSYGAALRDHGWRLIEVKTPLIVAEKDGRRVLVQLTDTRSGLVFVTLSDLA